MPTLSNVACADRDKIDMDEELASRLKKVNGLDIITRSGRGQAQGACDYNWGEWELANLSRLC